MPIEELAPGPHEERVDDLDVAPPGTDGSLVVLSEVWQDQEDGGLWQVAGIQRHRPSKRLEQVAGLPVGASKSEPMTFFSPDEWHRRFEWVGKDVESARATLGLRVHS